MGKEMTTRSGLLKELSEKAWAPPLAGPQDKMSALVNYRR